MRTVHGLLLGFMACACTWAAESRFETVVKKLRPHFMLGVTAGPGDKWIEETKAQGAQWDVRYQYLSGGVNTQHTWKTWNQPTGAFASIYLNESGKQGAIPCLTWYQMYQSLPCNAQGDEALGNKRNVETPATMKSFLEDFALLMKKCGDFGKPVIVHVEPDLWGYFLLNPAFKPNTADQVKVMVKSSGFAEAAEFEDTAAGFGKALVSLRDKNAPNVVLAWHASMWGRPNLKATAEFCQKSGPWISSSPIPATATRPGSWPRVTMRRGRGGRTKTSQPSATGPANCTNLPDSR